MQQVGRLDELIVELSYNCNLACTMCGFGGGKIDAERFMSLATLEHVIDSVHPEPRVIRLNGRGESTIHPRFVEALRYVRHRLPSSQINLFSHLSGTKSSILDALMECGVQLFISLDSPVPERAEAIRRRSRFDSVMANIERLRDHKPRHFLIFTLQEVNFEDLLPMAEFAASWGLHLLVNAVRRDEGIEPFQALVAKRAGDLRGWFAEIADLYEGLDVDCHLPDQIQGVQLSEADTVRTHGSLDRCPALERELCVLHDGTVTPCNMFNPYVYGNLLEQSLDDIRKGERFLWFRDHHKDHYYCANCACLGGTS